MATRVRVTLNHSEVRRMLRGEGQYVGVLHDLRRRAEAVAAAAGEGFEADTFVGRNRARAGVITATPAAMEAEARDHTLIRALDAARD